MMVDLIRQELLLLSSGVQTVPGRFYSGPAAYVLARGRPWASRVLGPRTIERVRRLTAGVAMAPRQCFANSILLSISHPELRYVEGYALFDAGVVVHHAWVSLGGAVIDLTPEWGAVIGEFAPPRAYLGVQIPRRTVLSFGFHNGNPGSLIDAWERGWPLLQTRRWPGGTRRA